MKHVLKIITAMIITFYIALNMVIGMATTTRDIKCDRGYDYNYKKVFAPGFSAGCWLGERDIPEEAKYQYLYDIETEYDIIDSLAKRCHLNYSENYRYAGVSFADREGNRWPLLEIINMISLGQCDKPVPIQIKDNGECRKDESGNCMILFDSK